METFLELPDRWVQHEKQKRKKSTAKIPEVEGSEATGPVQSRLFFGYLDVRMWCLANAGKQSNTN
jgi:hypothetical protein